MKEKILILGTGFIGSRIKEEIEAEASSRQINSFKDAEDEIKRINPSTIINCIGYVGRNVDDCEKELDTTLLSNSFLPIMLAEVSIRNNIRLVHLSSGCIYHYDYEKSLPLSEDDLPDFFELFYSRSKIYSERALEALSHKYPILITRIRIPLDNKPNPRNLLNKLINYKKAIDIPNSVTYIPDFLKALKHLLEVKASGIYNVVNSGTLKYPELMDAYKKYVPNFNYDLLDFKKLNLIRTNLILSTKKLEDSGFKVRDIHEVLEECVKAYIKY